MYLYVWKDFLEDKVWMHHNRDERDALMFCLESSYSEGPYFVIHFHPKCISNWSFNSELCIVIQTDMN